MGSKDDEMKQVFIEESLDHLSSIEADLLLMEEGGDTIDGELVNKVFRTVHSIKGGSGFLGLTGIKSLSHEMETVLGNIRSGRMVPTAEVIHFLLLASDALEYMILHMDESDEIDISQHLEALKSLGRVTSMASSPSLTDMPESRDGEGALPGETVAGKTDPVVEDLILTDPSLETVQVTTAEGAVLFSLEGQSVCNARDENKDVFFIEIPLTPQGDKDPEALAELISQEIRTYGTVLKSRVEFQYVPRGNHAPRGAFLLIVFASVLALEDIRLLFEVDAGLIFQLTKTGEPLPAGETSLTVGESVGCDKIQCAVDEAPKESEKIGSGKVRGEDKNSGAEMGKNPKNSLRDTAAPPMAETPPAADIGMDLSRDRRRGTGDTETSLRVGLKLLDALMTLAGELVLSRNQLLQAISCKDTHATEVVSQRIDLITSELQQTVMSTRMQQMSKVFDRFPRLVRDLAGNLGKEVRLTMRGKQVELDKTLLEAVTDPLIHLVRNAIDHGIESPDIRRSLGKDRTGQIFLRAFHEAGKVNIDISDDGRGLDGNLLADRAVLLGIITNDRAREMSDKEKLHLIFLPGFSMASQVTDLSGRGVGMDVVKNNMNAIGGQVDIESQPGIGTRFLIKVPLTLAIIPSQIVVAEGERYAIPQLNLEELVRIPANRVREKIEYVGDAQVVRLREVLLPLVRLTDIIGLNRTYFCNDTGQRKKDHRENIADRRSPRQDSPGESTEMAVALKPKASIRNTPPVACRTDRRYRATSALNITVLSTGTLKYGLIVDELHDSEEIVVKPLGRHLQQCRAYAGATIMGDGRVALILDVANLAEMAGVMAVVEKDFSTVVGHTRKTGSDEHQKTLSLLTFMGGEAEPFAVPLDRVVRIEKISCEKMETIGKMRVVQSRGKTLPLFTVDEVTTAAPLPPLTHFIVIVFEMNGREWGVLGSGPVDAVEVNGILDEKTLKQPGISGSIPIEGHTTMVVNISEMIAILQPQWLPSSQAPISAPELPTILIAEDSGFFRNQIKHYIEQEGYHVIAAEDGQIALDLIKDHVDTLSLVVTDLEMPNLDGFALTEKIKTDPRYAHLPVIALSTLADDRNMARGDAVGVDDYQLKLDRKMLLKSIKHQIQRSQVK